MSRLIVVLALCAAFVFIIRYLKRQKLQQTRNNGKKNKAQNTQIKPKGRLVQDPETGEYHIEKDDK